MLKVFYLKVEMKFYLYFFYGCLLILFYNKCIFINLDMFCRFMILGLCYILMFVVYLLLKIEIVIGLFICEV